MKTVSLFADKRFQIGCDRCGNGAGPFFEDRSLAGRWFEDALMPDDIASHNCALCDGSGEIDHECDCERCDICYDECDECDGSGVAKKKLPIESPVWKYFHKTALNHAYCPQCTEAMINERLVTPCRA